MNPSTYDRIRERAYQLWEMDGAKHGEDWNYWLQAEREITGGNGGVSLENVVKEKKTSAKKTTSAAPMKKTLVPGSIPTRGNRSKSTIL